MINEAVTWALFGLLASTAAFALLILVFGVKAPLVIPGVVCAVLLFGVSQTIRRSMGRKYDDQ